MNVTDYKNIIKQTAVYPRKVDNFGLAYTWLGLIDETEEYYKTNPLEVKALKKEFGDVLWYVCAVCGETGVSFEAVINEYLKMEIGYDTISVLEYSGKIKKFYRDKTAINTVELQKVLANHIFDLYFYAYDISEDWHASDKSMPIIDLKDCLPEILEMNYNKLIARRETNTLHGSGDNREER